MTRKKLAVILAVALALALPTNVFAAGDSNQSDKEYFQEKIDLYNQLGEKLSHELEKLTEIPFQKLEAKEREQVEIIVVPWEEKNKPPETATIPWIPIPGLILIPWGK